MFRLILAALAALALSAPASAQQCGPAGCPPQGRAVASSRVVVQTSVRSGAIVRDRWTPLANAREKAQERREARKEKRGR